MSLRDFLMAASVGGGKNFRPVAGFRSTDGRIVSPGKLYRSGFPGCLPDEARRLALDSGLRTVITFQTRRELEILDFSLERILPEALWEHIPIGERWFADDEARYPGDLGDFSDFYLAMVLDHGEGWARFFEILAESHRVPALFHCTAGRDRTGVAALLILEVLRVSRREIRTDYVASNAAFGKEHAQDEAVLDRLLGAIDQAGGIDRFLANLGIRREVLDELRHNLLAPPAVAQATP